MSPIRLDPGAVLRREACGRPSRRGLRVHLGRRLEQAHIEVVVRVPSASIARGSRLQVADLHRARLGDDDDRVAVPDEPGRDEVRPAVGPDRGQPDDRFHLEEPADPCRGQAVRVHAGSIGAAGSGISRRRSFTGMDIRRRRVSDPCRPPACRPGHRADRRGRRHPTPRRRLPGRRAAHRGARRGRRRPPHRPHRPVPSRSGSAYR